MMADAKSNGSANHINQNYNVGMAPRPLDLGDTNIFQNETSPLKGDETF